MVEHGDAGGSPTERLKCSMYFQTLSSKYSGREEEMSGRGAWQIPDIPHPGQHLSEVQRPSPGRC